MDRKTYKKFKALGIGEVLWDLLPEGKELGGAPANFAFHASQLHVDSSVISAVGKDRLGEEIIGILTKKNLADLVQKNEKPTGIVTVSLDEKGIPAYRIQEDVAWDYVEITGEALAYVKNVDAFCFGSLAQRSKKTQDTIHALLRSTRPDALKVFDINIRQHFYRRDMIESSLQLANILKINDDELRLVSDMFNLVGDESEIINQILGLYHLDYLAYTKGSSGSWLLSRQNTSYIETPKVKVADTVGAGDSFTAAMIAGLLHKLPFEDVHQLAVDVSAFVCTKEGATPHLPRGLVSRLYT